MKVIVEGLGNANISDQSFLASGGEADVYVLDKNLVAKIYQDKTKIIPSNKIKELQSIKNDNVIIPKHIIYDTNNNMIGYAMKYIPDAIPLCKFFTKSFKEPNGISHDKILEIINKIRLTLEDIHKNNCLVVDINEMNILVSKDFKDIYFIDTDSYQTRNYPATALMDHIRDRTIKNGKWNQGSDWFSFAVISFNMLTNVHPFRGSHPNYKKQDLDGRMKDGVSALDPQSSVPKIANDFSVIPKNYLTWYKDVFSNKKRHAPPNSYGDTNILQVTHKVDDHSQVKKELKVSLGETILRAYSFFGSYYSITPSGIYKENKKLPVSADFKNSNLIVVDNSPFIVEHVGDKLSVLTMQGEKVFEEICDEKFYFDSNVFYSKVNSHFFQHHFKKIGNKLIQVKRICANIMPNSSSIFGSLVLQNAFGKYIMNIPYDTQMCSSCFVPELEGHKIIDAKREKNIVIVLSHFKGVYNRLIFFFDKNYSKYELRIDEDISLYDISFTVLNNGVTVMGKESSIEIFVKGQSKEISTSPFYCNNKIFSINGELHYTDGNEIYSARMS